MADVTLTYKGSTIAEMSNTGSKTLKTAGKYCEGDIGVSYVKPSSGGSGFWDEDYSRQIIEGTFTEIIWPSGVTRITGKIFNDNDNLTNVTLPNTLVFIGSGVFSSCSNLKITTIPAGVRTIGASAFSHCVSIQTLDILGGPDIGLYAFQNCTSLTQVIYRGSGKEIYDYAFYSCINLSTVIIRSSEVCSIKNNTFSYTSLSKGYVYVPESLVVCSI